MFNHIKVLLENLTNESKIVASICGIWGWFCGLFLLDVGPTWVYIIKSCAGVCFGGVGIFVGLVVKDFYTHHLKHKLFKKQKYGDSEKNSEAEERA